MTGGAVDSSTHGSSVAVAASGGCDAPWSTGIGQCDAWLRDNIPDQDVLRSFGEIPLKNRKSIVLKAIQSPKESPVAWIAGCVNNHRTREMEKRLSAMASPHGAQRPQASSAALPAAVLPTAAPGVSVAAAGPSSLGPAAARALPMPASFGHPSMPAAQSMNQDPDMLGWAAEAWSRGSDSKSNLIRSVHATLAGDALRYFRELPAPIQASLATAWIFARPCAGPSSHELMLSWLRRYRSVANNTPSAATPLSETAVALTSIKVQVIIIGCTAGYQFLMLEAICKLATLRDCVTYTLLPILCCVADESTGDVAKHLASQTSNIADTKIMTECELATQVAAEANQWNQNSVKVFMITSLPMNVMNFTKRDDEESVLHSPVARHIWFSQSLSGRLMSVLGQKAVVDVVIAPYNLAAGARKLLENSVGPQVSNATPQDRHEAEKQVIVLCNVTAAHMSTPNMRVADARGPIDGWRSCCAQHADVSKAPLHIFRTLPALLSTRMFKERVLTAEEEDVVTLGVIEHEPTKQRRYASRAFLERWLGIEGTPLSNALRQTFPCSPWILPVTGESSEDSGMGQACGAERFCLGCEAMFATLSLVPAVHVVCPIVAGVFETGLRNWKGDSGQAWVTRDLQIPPHNCNPQCPRNPCTGK